MSETTTTTTSAPASIPTDQTATIAKLVVAVLTMILFVATLIVAYLTKDDRAVNLLTGAVITMAATTVNYWLGSAAGSAAKDATIAQIATPQITTTTGKTIP